MMAFLIERARALFDPIVFRLYVASIIGRLAQRFPYGAHRTILLALNTPTKVMENSSRDRAMLGYLQPVTALPLVPLLISSSADAGPTNFATVATQSAGGVLTTFVLRPDEVLFATATAFSTSILVATEWY